MIVITGKSGVGKTTLLKMLKFNDTYFADDFVKENLYQNDHPVFKTLVKKYPSIKIKGKIDITKLRNILFEDTKRLDEINELVYPYVASWLKSLPNKSLVEMAAYIHLEKMYAKFFKKVILISRKDPDVSKFGFQPIDDVKINYDYLIENKTLDQSLKILKKHLHLENFI